MLHDSVQTLSPPQCSAGLPVLTLSQCWLWTLLSARTLVLLRRYWSVDLTSSCCYWSVNLSSSGLTALLVAHTPRSATHSGSDLAGCGAASYTQLEEEDLKLNPENNGSSNKINFFVTINTI